MRIWLTKVRQSDTQLGIMQAMKKFAAGRWSRASYSTHDKVEPVRRCSSTQFDRAGQSSWDPVSASAPPLNALLSCDRVCTGFLHC